MIADSKKDIPYQKLGRDTKPSEKKDGGFGNPP
jgi:hypothetical protein